MPAPILSQRELEFMLYELFDAESLAARGRYSDHSRETSDAAVTLAGLFHCRYELLRISVWAKILLDLDDTCYAMSPDWF